MHDAKKRRHKQIFLQVSDVFCLLHQSEVYGQYDNTASSVTGTEANVYTLNLLSSALFFSAPFFFFLTVVTSQYMPELVNVRKQRRRVLFSVRFI